MTSLKSDNISSNKTNISSVVKKNLCIGCGACKGICPNVDTIRFKEKRGLNVPFINEETCTNCGLCYRVCPGDKINLDALNNLTFSKSGKRDKFIGNIISVWVGYSNNSELRYKAASGGLATSILTYALRANIIDSAVVVKFDPDNPLMPKVIFTEDTEEVNQSRGSKYFPVPMAEAVSYIKSNDKKVAFVGLPCHIQAVKMASKYNEKLRENIVFYLGLFCQWPPSYDGLDFLLRLKNINPDEVEHFEFRGNGWPGGMTIETKSKEKKFIPLSEYWGILSKFVLNRCLVCPEVLNEFADISLGDAWGQGYLNDKSGTSVVVIRTENGKEIWNSLRKSGEITADEANEAMLKKSQIRVLELKKLNHASKVFTFKRLNMPIPEFKGIYENRIIKIEVLRTLNILINRKILKTKKLWPILISIIKLKIILKKGLRTIKIYIKSIFRRENNENSNN
jgi:coenzyme F420 hydrogenase subunit beta